MTGFAPELIPPALERSGDRLDSRIVWLTLGLATCLAAALRLPFLGHQSLWLDETFTRDILGAHGLSGLWNQLKATESTPPLFYVIGWLLGGRSAAAMRAIPAVALILSVPVAYFAFRRFTGVRTALAAALVIAVSPELVQYATDARAYGLLVLCGLLSVWAMSAVLENPTPKAYALWGLAALASIWTHYFGAFLVAGEAAVLLFSLPRDRRATLGSAVTVAVLSAPLIPLGLSQNGGRSAFIASISLPSRFTGSVREFAMGTNVPRTWLEAAGVVVWCVAVAAGSISALRAGNGRRVLLVLAVAAFVVPLLAAVVGFEDRFYARNVIETIPLAAALAASALVAFRGAPLVLYLVLSIVTSVWVATDWRYEQTNWRDALHRVEAIAPAAPVVAVTPSSAPVVRTYLGRGPATTPIVADRAWVVVEPVRASGQRALGPARVPAIPGFTARRSSVLDGFRLVLVAAPAPVPLRPPPGTTVFPGATPP